MAKKKKEKSPYKRTLKKFEEFLDSNNPLAVSQVFRSEFLNYLSLTHSTGFGLYFGEYLSYLDEFFEVMDIAIAEKSRHTSI